jgi:hypothetical protein
MLEILIALGATLETACGKHVDIIIIIIITFGS